MSCLNTAICKYASPCFTNTWANIFTENVFRVANCQPQNHKMLVNHDHIKDMIGTSYRIADFKRPHGTNLLEVQDINFAKERTRTNPFLCFASIFKFVTCGSLNFGVADMSDSCAQHPPFPFNLRFWQFDTIWTLMKMIETFGAIYEIYDWWNFVW